MAVFGYARVSTDGQTLASQDAELITAGCAKVYQEKVSGTRTDRAELERRSSFAISSSYATPCVCRDTAGKRNEDLGD